MQTITTYMPSLAFNPFVFAFVGIVTIVAVIRYRAYIWNKICRFASFITTQLSKLVKTRVFTQVIPMLILVSVLSTSIGVAGLKVLRDNKATVAKISGMATVYVAEAVNDSTGVPSKIHNTEDLMSEELKKACTCESGFTHINPATGHPVLGFNVKHKSVDVGICQVNEKIWAKTANKLGYDIYEREDNIRMAIYIEATEGISSFLAYNAKTGKCNK